MSDAPRSKEFLLAEPEARLLRRLAHRLPSRVMPDHLTLLGVLAAFGLASAYLASNADPAWLWVASALLVVHWVTRSTARWPGSGAPSGRLTATTSTTWWTRSRPR